MSDPAWPFPMAPRPGFDKVSELYLAEILRERLSRQGKSFFCCSEIKKISNLTTKKKTKIRVQKLIKLILS